MARAHGRSPGPSNVLKSKVRVPLRLGGSYVCSFEPSRRAGNESGLEQLEHCFCHFPKKLLSGFSSHRSCSVQHLPVCRWRTRTRLPVNTIICTALVFLRLSVLRCSCHPQRCAACARVRPRAWARSSMAAAAAATAALPPDWDSHQDGGNCVTPRSTAPLVRPPEPHHWRTRASRTG